MSAGTLSIKPLWISDPHLDRLHKEDPQALSRLRRVLDTDNITHILLGGDIADSRTFEEELRRFCEACGRPVYFVLGNHDYYFSSVADMQSRASALDIPDVQWLPDAGVVPLNDNTALVGQGGWGDAHRGDLEDFVILTDYAAISDLALMIDHEDFWVRGFTEREKLVSKLQALGWEAADALSRHLTEAAKNFTQILILTHVTPFYQTCTYKDLPGNEKGFPGFLWDTMGSLLDDFAASHPDISISVFSGHTHQESQGQIAPNLRAWSAKAEYGELFYRILNPDGGWLPGPTKKV